MELKVSRPIKILALILVIAGVGGVASLQMLGKSSGNTSGSAALSVAQIRARAHGGQAATTPASTAKPKAHTVTPPKPFVVKPKPKPVRAPARIVDAHGLPVILADALRAHRIVVVSIFDPQSQTDAVSYAEARAGAADAGAGFLGVSVLDDMVAGPLTAALPGGGLLPDPGVLVYRAPGTLVERIDGFLDRDGVAQLVVSGHTATAVTTGPVAAAAPPAAVTP